MEIDDYENIKNQMNDFIEELIKNDDHKNSLKN